MTSMTASDQGGHFRDLALSAAHTGRTRFSRFLEPSEEDEAIQTARKAGCEVTFSGGFEGAERRMAAFSDGSVPQSDFPIASLEVRWNPKFNDVRHRDLLGAVMGLGLERSATGDIVPGTAPGTAYLFCTDDIADYISASLDSAGRASIRIRRAEEISIAPPEGETLRVTVQALRLDAVLAAGCRLSRSAAQRLISAGLVKRNHVVELRGDIRLEEGDLVSVRGFGRLRVDSIAGENRRGRTAVLLFRCGK